VAQIDFRLVQTAVMGGRDSDQPVILPEEPHNLDHPARSHRRGRGEALEPEVRGDLRPVRALRSRSGGTQGRDRRLELVRSCLAPVPDLVDQLGALYSPGWVRGGGAAARLRESNVAIPPTQEEFGMDDTSPKVPRGEADRPTTPAFSSQSAGSSPGSPSWWPGLSQPSQGEDRPGVPPPGRRVSARRKKLLWLIGASAATVTCGIIAALALTGSGRSDSTKMPQAASGRFFTDAPDGCSLIKLTTIDAYAPGAACTPSPFDRPVTPGLTIKMPSWSADTSSRTSRGVSIDLDLCIGSGVLDTYSSEKDSAAHIFALVRESYRTDKDGITGKFDGTRITLKASHPLMKIGDEAYFYYGISTVPESAEAEVVVLSGTAEFTVSYSGTRDGTEAPISQREAEAALTAIARDVLKSLR